MKTERLAYYKSLARRGNKSAQRVVDAFDPDQPRDERGEWAGSGSGESKGVEPGGMTPGQINKELDKLDAQGSKLTDKFIASGRGYEKPSETFTKSDPLAIEFKALQERKSSLRSEIERRYGPGAPRRLPPGFKKRQ